MVTGGGRGIGRSICQTFALEGASIVIAARGKEEIELVAREIADDGGQAVAHPVDVTDKTSVDELLSATIARFGTIDILVNCAGYYKASRFVDYSHEDWKRIIDVNLHGTFLCTQAALPYMLKKGSGKIVNIASTAAKWGSYYQSAYNASKHAILGLTRSLALEVAAAGVNVNAVCPGFVETDMLKDLLGQFTHIMGMDEGQVLAAMKARVPQGRFLQPSEVAEAALYLASPEADGITGIGLTMAGGMILI